jgi:hypothetical protein
MDTAAEPQSLRANAGLQILDSICWKSRNVPRSNIARIREKIRLRQYDMSAHAMEEMAEDLLDITDIENALLHGQITRIERGDPRGTKYIVEGIASDQSTLVGVVGRFTGTGRYLIITVHTIRDVGEK